MSGANTKRLALVTGASRGIGRAVALELARQNWRVIAVARAQKALEKLDDDIRALGGEATLIPLDLRDGSAIDQLAAPLFERFGKLDGLAACAGALGSLTPAHQATPAIIDETIQVNYLANQRLIRALHPLLRESDAGRAVFLTSGASKNPRAYWAPYAASKAALDALVISWAAEIGNITPMRANLFNPGPTRTSMRAKAFPGEDPMTLPAPEEVAPSVVQMLQPSYNENGAWVQFERAS
ncbi:SDR family NAD(P)-dependent oxidoreductase [Candidatus Viadribacter manganicus]|uniref:Oxidoreductase n=1 Tax=Candidatus Viadribacter manganicus TaxID=1759059 RepID=A0A1B1AE10_9PROT|nr:SDR family NAD(P)-dependent oxidoreductase [Candidatus Viadribacter manganicus]ANP44798.1 oxidoreductase [Candidatus Viadribacter manganicus]